MKTHKPTLLIANFSVIIMTVQEALMEQTKKLVMT